MPAPKGHARYGGRVKGTPNKSSLLVKEALEQLGVDPIEVLAMFARGDWQALGYDSDKIATSHSEFGTTYKYTIDPAIRAKCAMDLVGYVYSKRKAIDIAMEVSGRSEEIRSLPKEEQIKMLEAGLAKLKNG
jgi:hypothetical protein